MVFVVICVLGIGLVIALVAGVGWFAHKVDTALKAEQKVEDKTHIATLPIYWDDSHPPQYDVWKRPVTCSVQSDGSVVASGTVKNNTSAAKSYFITVSFTQNGRQIGTGGDGVANVQAGAVAPWRATLVDASTSGKVSCAVTTIWRSGLASIIPGG